MNRFFLIAVCCCLPTPSVAAVVIFFEGLVDGVDGNVSYASTSWMMPSPLTYSGSGDTRMTFAWGADRPAGATGGRHVFLGANTQSNPNNNHTFVIGGIDSRGYQPDSFTLSFAAHKDRIADNMQDLDVEYSIDGEEFVRLLPDGLPAQATGTGTANWRLIELTELSLPATDQLQLRFTNRSPVPSTNNGTAYRLDDFSLQARAVPEPASALWLTISGAGTLWWRRHHRRGGRLPVNRLQV